MGCSVSKRDHRKPVKYDYLQNDGTHKSGKDIRSQGDKGKQAKLKNSFTELNTDNNRGPPTEIHSAVPIQHEVQPAKLPIIDEYYQIENKNLKTNSTPRLKGLSKAPFPDFDPISTVISGERADLTTLKHTQDKKQGTNEERVASEVDIIT